MNRFSAYSVIRLVVLAGAMFMLVRCAGSRGSTAETTPGVNTQEKAQTVLKQHNAVTPIVGKTACIPALEAVLDSITGTKYVFVGFAPERWATGGRQMLFVPYMARLGTRKQVVTLVVDDFCKIEGLIWPE